MPPRIVHARPPPRSPPQKKVRPPPACGPLIKARDPKAIKAERARLEMFDVVASRADLFPVRSPPMVSSMRPATPEEIAECLKFALREEGKADPAMAKIAAERIVLHLDSSGFVLIRREELTP